LSTILKRIGRVVVVVVVASSPVQLGIVALPEALCKKVLSEV